MMLWTPFPCPKCSADQELSKNVKEESIMEYVTLNNGIKMPMAGIGPFF